jgi:hypothetical protein
VIDGSVNVTNGTVYFSALIEPNNGDASNHNAALILGSDPLNAPGGVPGALMTAGEGIGFGLNGYTLHAYIYDGGVGTESTGSVAAANGSTLLIVGEIIWGATDTLNLYSITDVSAPLPTAFATVSGDLDESLFDTLAIADKRQTGIDEIRFGTEFADVVPGPVAELTVNPATMRISHILSSVTSTSSVDVSYLSVTNMDITISISDQTHPDAFSVLSATNQTLTTPYPATTALEFQFDNAEAGLAVGETATGLVTIAWSEVGGGTNGLVLVPISATAKDVPGLLAEFTFDTDTTDTAGGYGYDGILGAGATVSNGVLTLDNGGFMDLAAAFGDVNPFDGSGDFTIEMDYKATTGNTLISSARDATTTANHSMAVYLTQYNDNEDRLYYDNWYVGAARIRAFADQGNDLTDGQWRTVRVTYDADGNDGSPLILLRVLGELDAIASFNPAIPDIFEDTVRIGGSLNTTFPGVVSNNVLTVDNVRIYDLVPSAELIVDPYDIAISHGLLDAASTSTVDVSYFSATNMDITVSISDQTHPDAFSVLSVTNQTLTNAYPAWTALEFEFDNTEAGLSSGETATGLVTIDWSETGGGTNGQVLVPISATVEDPELIVDPAAMEILHNLSGGATSMSTVDVSYVSTMDMDITISISDETVSGAFSVLSATNQTLTTPYPATTALEFEFNNSTAGLAQGETATGLVTIAWSEVGGGTNGQVLVPISAVAFAQPEGTLYYENFSTDPGYINGGLTSIGADTNGAGPYFTFGEYNGSGDIGETTTTGVLHIDSNTDGNSARSRGLSVFIDTSAAIEGTYTVSFDVSNWVDGTGTAGVKVFEGNGLDIGYIDLDNGDNAGNGNVPRYTAGTNTTWNSLLSGTVGITGDGTVRFEVTLTEAGQPGDYLALAWVQVRSTSTNLAPTLDIDNVWVGVGTPPVPPVDGYSDWAESYDLVGDEADEKADLEYDGLGDGLDNLMEYALGGNPTNDDAAAVSPATFMADAHGTEWLYHVHNQNLDTNLTFTVGATPDLVLTAADTNDVDEVGTSEPSGGFKSVTNRTEAVIDAKFIKLEVSK